MKSKYLLSFILGVVVASSISINLSTRAIKSIHTGYSLWLEGKISQALESFKLAQNIWPPLFYEPETKSIIKFSEENSRSSNSVTIFLKEEASESEINGLIEEIKLISGIKKVSFISKEDRLTEYKEKNKDNPLLLELVSLDIFPKSIYIEVNNPESKDNISNLLQNKDFIDDFN